MQVAKHCLLPATTTGSPLRPIHHVVVYVEHWLSILLNASALSNVLHTAVIHLPAVYFNQLV